MPDDARMSDSERQQIRDNERVKYRLEDHDRQIDQLRKGQSQTTQTLSHMQQKLDSIERTMAEGAAAAKALADQATKTFTARQLYTAVALVIITLAGLILGTSSHL